MSKPKKRRGLQFPRTFRFRIESLYMTGVDFEGKRDIFGPPEPRECFALSAESLCGRIADDIASRSNGPWSFTVWIEGAGTFEVRPRTGYDVERVR